MIKNLLASCKQEKLIYSLKIKILKRRLRFTKLNVFSIKKRVDKGKKMKDMTINQTTEVLLIKILHKHLNSKSSLSMETVLVNKVIN